MRQLIFQVPQGKGRDVLQAAKNFDAINLSCSAASNESGPIEVATVHISNSKVENLLSELEHIEHLHVTLFPRGVIALRPPSSKTNRSATANALSRIISAGKRNRLWRANQRLLGSTCRAWRLTRADCL